MSRAENPQSLQASTILSQNMLNLFCSRARAALMEATSAARQSGPDSYYDVWHYRLAMEMVCPRTHPNAESSFSLASSGSSGDLPWRGNPKIQIPLRSAIFETNASVHQNAIWRHGGFEGLPPGDRQPLPGHRPVPNCQ